MKTQDIRTALITGASAGLGAEYARRLAAAGTGLILVARRRERLADLASGLESAHGVPVEVLQADLSNAEDLARLERRVADCPTLDLLVNNAGFGGIGGFAKSEIGSHQAMIDVHVTATVRLCRASLPGMVARGRGGIINVASVAAFSPFSGPMYAGTKAFLVMFSENLRNELRGTGVRVQALCPGFTHTDFHEVIGMNVSGVPRFMWMTPEAVVRMSLRRLGRGAVCVTGGVNKASAHLLRSPMTAAVIRAAAGLPIVRKLSAR